MPWLNEKGMCLLFGNSHELKQMGPGRNPKTIDEEVKKASEDFNGRVI